LTAYFDPSFLVSLYSIDANSLDASRAMSTISGTFHISTLGELELLNALELKVFRKEISAAQARVSRKTFEKDIESGVFHILMLSDQVFERARHISLQTTAKYGTRAADLLHIAAALELKAESFYSFDTKQRRLAQIVRLKTP
jgi:predicted nucleic acid-binding protein